ncbi:MAG TPA: hypothetical protein VGM16_09085 [Gammaproteobacteria bacterium]|jgi:hypothetical protein
MEIIMRIFKTAILALTLIGCSGAPEKGELEEIVVAKPGYALVYVYREDYLEFMTRNVMIREGDQNLALLTNRSYAYFWLPLGRHTLSSFAWEVVNGTEYTQNFQDRKIYYLKIKFEKFDPKVTTMPNLSLMEAAFIPMEPGTAKNDISDLHLSKLPN